VVEALTDAALRDEHRRWLRPDLAEITVVGDVTMSQLLPALEQAFGDWQAPAGPPPSKDLAAPTPPAQPRLVVIDRPNSPQSVLMLGRRLPLEGTSGGTEALDLANEVIGNGFLSRLNMNLREEKGWTYGIRSSLPGVTGPRSLVVVTPVQGDRTADSIRLILDEMRAFPSTRGVDEPELQRVTEGNIRGMPNRFQTNAQVLGALLENRRLGRPDDYYERLPDIYRTLDAEAIDAAAEQYLAPEDLVIVVVGDRGQIEEQLAGLDLPVEYMAADTL
jgi:predicted Zn-dependent peptidase